MMHIGVDIGGTFTDCVAVDRDGRRSSAKDALAMMRGAGRVAGSPIERVYRVHGSKRPAPLMDRTTVLALDERIDSKGHVVVALDPVLAARRQQEFVEAGGFESVAGPPPERSASARRQAAMACGHHLA